uniref:Uncharacterized protein n=1 Tax=Opuntia streptacantha TaxID=393608 RepID=A0A7C8YUY5_OPUST
MEYGGTKPEKYQLCVLASTGDCHFGSHVEQQNSSGFPRLPSWQLAILAATVGFYFTTEPQAWRVWLLDLRFAVSLRRTSGSYDLIQPLDLVTSFSSVLSARNQARDRDRTGVYKFGSVKV